jgi:hypothetical protein
VTRDAPAEILVSADAKNGRDLPFFSAGNFYFYFIFNFFADASVEFFGILFRMTYLLRACRGLKYLQ